MIFIVYVHLFFLDPAIKRLNPDLLTGDFDSIKPEVKQFFKSQGCEIIHTEDQVRTNFNLTRINNYEIIIV